MTSKKASLELPAKIFGIGMPTRAQLVIDARNVVITFVVAAYGTWQLGGHQTTRSAVVAATIAGGLAVVSLIKSYLTTI